MAGSGRIPKEHTARPRDEKRRRRGTWQPAPGRGWQHGPIPDPPDGLMPESVNAWQTWFGAWFASYWLPEDVPGLTVLVGLYDELRRGKYQRAAEARAWADTYGITPKGQQDRRWRRPTASARPGKPAADAYAHLRILEKPE